MGGIPFTHLAPGPYSAEVTDNAISHNFHVIGPGVDQATSIDGTGAVTWPLTLVDGFYDWQCDVHPTAMFGRFTVGNVLTVVKNGTGGGSVSSNPAGIACGGTCRAAFPAGGTVTLTATPAVGSTFTGWSGGGCSGNGDCQVPVNGDVAVTATFTLSGPPPPPPPPPGPPTTVTRVTVTKSNGIRTVVSKLNVIRRTAAKAQLIRGTRLKAQASATFVPGAKTLKIRVPRTLSAGNATVKFTFKDSVSGQTVVVKKTVQDPALTRLGARPSIAYSRGRQLPGASMRRPVLAAAAAFALAVPASAGAQTPTPTQLNGSVGVIGIQLPLTRNGIQVTELPTGPYRITVVDQTAGHSFHLQGPGVDQGTSILGTGTVTWDVEFTHARYNWFCDVHPTAMYGTVTVGNFLVIEPEGFGSITSSPTGISCLPFCEAGFPSGGTVQLTPTAPPGFRFAGWQEGPCSGNGPCSVDVNGSVFLRARFERDPAAPPPPRPRRPRRRARCRRRSPT